MLLRPSGNGHRMRSPQEVLGVWDNASGDPLQEVSFENDGGLAIDAADFSKPIQMSRRGSGEGLPV